MHSVIQSCPILRDPMDCSLPGSSVLGIILLRNTGVRCHFLLQGILPTQGLNPRLLHCQADFSPLSHQRSPICGRFVFVQSLSCVRLSVSPWTAARQAPLPFTVSQCLLRFTSIELMMLSTHLIFCCPLLFFAFNLSQHQDLSQRLGSLHRVDKVLELQHQSFQ